LMLGAKFPVIFSASFGTSTSRTYSIDRSGIAITPHAGCVASQAKVTQLCLYSHSPSAGPKVGL